jgi:hypothetical protein
MAILVCVASFCRTKIFFFLIFFLPISGTHGNEILIYIYVCVCILCVFFLILQIVHLILECQIDDIYFVVTDMRNRVMSSFSLNLANGFSMKEGISRSASFCS